jgi:hypothetical protein
MSVPVADIEKLMELMSRHEIDELSWSGMVAVSNSVGSMNVDPVTVTLRKSRHRPPAAQLAEPDLAKHLEPLPNEPWNAIPQEDVDNWAEKAGV